MLQLESGQKPTKSFWEKPEGNTGMIVLGIVALGGFFVLNSWLPAINNFLDQAITAVGQTFVLGGMIAALAAIIYLVMNRKVQLLVSFGFKSIMRWLTGRFIEIDPIGIMKGYIEILQQKKANFDAQKAKLKGQMRLVGQTVSDQQKDLTNVMYALSAADKEGNVKEKTFQAREHGRLTDSIERYQVSYKKMEMIHGVLTKVAEACDYTIRDITSDVKHKEQDRKMMAATSSAIGSAMAILKGNTAERELFDQAMEFVVEDYAMKLGAMDEFMDSTESILTGIDMQNGMWNEKAMAALEAWEQRSDNILVGGEKRLMVENASTSPIDFGKMGSEQKVPVQQNNDFNKFFNK